MQPIYEGKAKRLWTTDDPSTLRMEFKNDATAFNGEKKASFENKGRLNNAISTLILVVTAVLIWASDRLSKDKPISTH